MSLLRKVKIEKGDSQSEVGLSWLLIVLSICLMAFAVVECFLEVQLYACRMCRHRHDVCIVPMIGLSIVALGNSGM